MTTWHIDLGFDSNASSPATDLMWGLVTSPNGSAGSIYKIQPGDQVAFFIFNITAGASQTQVTSVSVTSSAGVNNQNTTNPWSGGTNPFASIPQAQVQQLTAPKSTVFNTVVQGWQVTTSNGGLLYGTIGTQGQFSFTFNVSVQTTGGTNETYTTDPVMIVTSGS